jgi:hypothetical protein
MSIEPDRDPRLSELLREWQVGGAPPSLEQKVLGPRRRWWESLFTGYVRVPVPVGFAVAVALVVLAIIAARGPALPANPSTTVTSLRDFRPVDHPNVRIIRGAYANQ